LDSSQGFLAFAELIATSSMFLAPIGNSEASAIDVRESPKWLRPPSPKTDTGGPGLRKQFSQPLITPSSSR